MANPIPYNQLFDIDGLKVAIVDCEGASDAFSAAVTEDFKRINTSVTALTKSLQALNDTMGARTIKLVDEASQQAIVDYAQQVIALTKQIKDQQAAIAAMTGVVNANKQAVADAKVQQAQYAAQLAQGKVAQQQIAIQIAQTTLQQKQLALALKQATTAQTAATGSYNEAAQKLKALGIQIKSLPGEFQNATAAGKALIDQYNKLNNGLKAFDASMGNHQRNVGNYKDVLDGLVGQLTAVAAGYLSIQGALELAKKAFDTALVTDANRTALNYILGSTELANAKMIMLKKTAEDMGLEFNSLARAYDTFTGAAKASNFNLADSDKIFQSVARAAGVMHLTSDQTTSALRALSRMMETGTVQARYLQNELGIYVPQATAAMADALGIPISKLHEMEKQGGIVSSEVLPKFAESLNKLVAPGVKNINSLQAAWNKFLNTFSEGVDDNTHIKNFFTYFVTGVTYLSDSIMKTVNSTSWGEFWSRLQKLDPQIFGVSHKNPDKIHAANRDKNEVAIEQFAGSGQTQQIELLKTQTAIRDRAYKTALSGKQSDIRYYNEMQGVLTKLRDIYAGLYTEKKKFTEIPDSELNSITGIRQRITELSKLPTSADKGSEINDRIDALKKRLHDLQPDLKKAKDGFKLLEEQIQKALLSLQHQIIVDHKNNQGVATKRTLELAKAYDKLVLALENLKGAQAQAQINDLLGPGKNIRGNHELSATQTSTVVDKNGATQGEAAGLSDALQHSDLTGELDSLLKQLGSVESAYDKTNRKILSSYKAKKISILQYEAEIQASQEKEADAIYAIQMKSFDVQLQLAINEHGKQSKEYESILKQKDALEKTYNDKSLDRDRRQYEIQQRILAQTAQLLVKNGSVVGQSTGNPGLGALTSRIGNDLVNGIGKKDQLEETAKLGMDSIQAYTDFAINASMQRQAQFEQEMAYEMQGAGNNSLAKRRIEQEYTQKVKEERTKQARLNKAAAAIEIILNTAIAVSKTLSQGGILGIPLSVIVAALGAVELGIVLASPIPQYEKGRESGPATIAEVNEKGPEALVKNGRVRFANQGRRGLTYLEKDEKVMRADETAKWVETQTANAENISRSKSIYDTYIMSHTGKQNIDYGQMASAMTEAVSKLPLEQNVWDERGHAHYRRTQNTRIRSVRNRNTF